MLRTFVAVLAAASFTACSSSAKPITTHTYNGTASVGDFLTVTVDTTAKTIAYANYTNGDSGTVSYTVAADGSYTITDPKGNLITAYELPGLALVMQVGGAGPSHDQPALLVAIEKADTTKASISGKSFNILQFRTTSGGIDVVHVEVDSSANAFVSSYGPKDAFFETFTMDAASLQDDPTLGAIRTVGASPGAGVTMFATPGGYLAIDNTNGSMFGSREASSKSFDPANAGTYNAIVYSKTDGPYAQPPEMAKATVNISAGGHIGVTSPGGTIDTNLIPFEDSGFYGPTKMTTANHGMFVFEGGGAGETVFVVFTDHGLAFGSFQDTSATDGAGAYHYAYGFALKQ